MFAIAMIVVSALSVPEPAWASSCGTVTAQPPTLTIYGVKSDTGCGGGSDYVVTDTCNQVYATWGGSWFWADNLGANVCNSNGDLLDFGPCHGGTWSYRTRSHEYRVSTGTHTDHYSATRGFTCA